MAWWWLVDAWTCALLCTVDFMSTVSSDDLFTRKVDGRGGDTCGRLRLTSISMTKRFFEIFERLMNDTPRADYDRMKIDRLSILASAN